MSAERLSRLQKWILEEVYVAGNKLTFLGKPPKVWRRAVYLQAHEDGLFKPDQDFDNTAKVTFARSVWGLIEKGYLEGIGPTSLNMIAMAYGVNGKEFGEFQKDFEGLLKERTRNQAIPGPAVRGVVQAKLLSLTHRGRIKVKQLLAASEALNVNKDKLAIRLGDGSVTVAPGGEIDNEGGEDDGTRR